MSRKGAALLAALVLALGLTAGASAAQTVADIESELTVLNNQIAQLRDELVTSGGPAGLPTASATALTRLDQLEAELRLLTNRVGVLSNDISRIVTEASNRVGDIEFRLTELEGGDTSLLGPPEPIAGGLTSVAPPKPRPMVGAIPGAVLPPAASGEEAQLTVTERADFDAAVVAAGAGDHARAATLFETFLATYPGGPLASEAQFRRGEALAAGENWNPAARSYLSAFSGDPTGPLAPRALYRLAVSLGRIGKTSEACRTLTEVDIRYPGSEVAGEVATERQTLACP